MSWIDDELKKAAEAEKEQTCDECKKKIGWNYHKLWGAKLCGDCYRDATHDA